ncbi:TonB-dependent receptor plug domain-containing protein [Sphingomonas turrisvirgatae]|uniref:TonB-dependent receptor n=1 Tax=Sphingomonas turrisvirgatae TaxID=1888892 RepID=A0A1E3LTS5_9SPHN|nr:TonB-dependent receptor [Sphingomonas turrisvirgatae]ODP37156.1 TonB-dependent receptor [Sphingomonas turrisvirgatae]
MLIRTMRQRQRAQLLCRSALAAALLSLPMAAHAQSADAANPAADEGIEASSEIVVTGSSIRGIPPTGSDLISVSREDAKLIGAASTPELLATVPQLNSFNTAPRVSNGGLGSFAPGLRGLPTAATLPLMNGHRLISGSTQQTNPDYPFIPELAIERVEIVADGASAIYGSEAVAGVVNFITRKRVKGLEAIVRYGIADDYNAFNAGAVFGQDWSGGSFLIAYQYQDNSNITGADRSYRSLDFRSVGGIDTRSAVCPDANVNLFAGTIYAAPGLAPGLNTCDPRGPVDLLPQNRTHSVFATARQAVSDKVTVWADFLYSDRRDVVQAALPGQTFVLITAANPFFRAPPGTGSLFGYFDFRPDRLVGADHFDQTFRVRSGNATAGIDIELPGGFQATAFGSFNFSRNDTFQPGINSTALTAAAAGTTTATALDPFGYNTSPAVVAAILDNPTTFDNRQRTRIGAVKVDGPLAQLPGGELKIAVGAEYRRETYRQRGQSGGVGFPEDLKRDVQSIYGELFVPIFGADNATPGAYSLALSLSGRYDHYSDFGSTSNPKIGLTWEPIEGVNLRGSYGRSFRAPGLRDLGSTVGSYYSAAALVDAFGARDPVRGAAQVNTILLYGGNLDLTPETARTWSAGIDLRPKAVPNLTASVTFYDIHYDNVIGTPSGLGALLFSDPTFASRVIRDPGAAQVSAAIANTVPFYYTFAAVPAIGNILDLRQGNFGVRETNGLDFDVRYRHTAAFGTVFGGVAGNYILNYRNQLSPTSAVSNSLDAGIPRRTLRTTLGVTAGPVTFVNFVNHRSGVTASYATPTGSALYEAKGYTTVDLRLTVRLPDLAFAKGLELGLQVNDLFDATPPFFPGTDGIGGAYNPIGRYAAMSLRTSF